MAPTATTSTASGTSTAMPIGSTPTLSSGFVGEDFINNLGSDLAPLLTLFGEQVTKQFLSMSLGWADHILLAAGPLGIITTVVSAIRVSNVRILKAIIGRAREKLATAELELLSSTSNVTSELWTEEGIVRQPGHAKILELIVYTRKFEAHSPLLGLDDIEPRRQSEVHIGDLEDAYQQGVFELADEGHSKLSMDVFGKLGFKSSEKSQNLAPSTFLEHDNRRKRDYRSKELERASKLANQPPNLILNTHNALTTSRELWTFTILGVALQFVAVAIPALTTYSLRKPKGTEPVQDYAYPTFLVGTCLLIVGIAMCSYIIEATTTERVYTPTGHFQVEKIFRLQFEQTMGDQPYKAYVILNRSDDKIIRTSRYDPDGTDEHGAPPSGLLGRVKRLVSKMTRKSPTLSSKDSAKSKMKTQRLSVIIAVILCFAGFICQFVGLRALHWSATIIQLSITLLMTCIRAWVRRGIANQPKTFQLPEKSDPNSVAISLSNAYRNTWPISGEPWPSMTFHPLIVPGLVDRTSNAEWMEKPIQLRMRFQSLFPDADSGLWNVCDKLRIAIRDLVSCFAGNNRSVYRWAHIVQSDCENNAEPQFYRLVLSSKDFSHKKRLHALLALWRYRNANSSKERCIAKIFSAKDVTSMTKLLSAQIGSALICSVLRLPRKPDVPRAGLSIDTMQYSTVSSGAQGVPLYGYLVIGWKSPVNPYPTEFLAGFMDELSRHVYLQYNLQTEEWRSKSGTREEKVLDIDEITRIWMDTGLFENEIDAKVMVVSSLARCTVWKETQGSNISTRRPAQHPEVSRPKVPSTEVEGLQRDQTTRGASATTKAEGILYTGAATSNFSDDQPSSTAEAPIGRHFSAVQVGDDSVTSATNAEDLENQPPPSPDTPLPSTSGAIQAHADEVKRAPTSSVSEHQSTPTARTPVARSVRAPEMGESSRTGAQMAEASGE